MYVDVLSQYISLPQGLKTLFKNVYLTRLSVSSY